MGKTDPNFPRKLFRTWPLFSGFWVFFQAPCHLWTVIALSHAEMLMTKEKVTFSALRNQGWISHTAIAVISAHPVDSDTFFYHYCSELLFLWNKYHAQLFLC